MATTRTLLFRRISAALLVLLLGLLGSCEEQVPLVLWTHQWTPQANQPLPAAGQIVEQQQLTGYLDKTLHTGPRNVLLFLQDKMSVEDFTLYGGVFGNKQDSVFPNLESALRSSSSSLVLPTVSWPGSNAVMGLLQEQLETSPLYMDPDTLSQLTLNSSSPALLVFRLPYYIGSVHRGFVLPPLDEVIGQVVSVMKSQSVPYTAIYTALRPSRGSPSLSMEAALLGGRSLLQRKMKEKAGVYAPVEFKEGESSCILLWAKGLSVSILRSGRWESHDLTPSTFGEGVSPKLHGSSCDKTKLFYIMLYYTTLLKGCVCPCSFAMSQRHYTVSARRWFTLDAIELEYDGTKATFNGSRNIYAPAEYSYRCKSVSSFQWPQLVPHSSKDPANQWRVAFEDFQIQGFNVSGSKFSYASDCAGFFSPGIWMGLMTSLLMVLVLTYGLHMIMQLHTMDRFDDPKGPAISVPQTD
uniref:ATPase H+ transporting accessory protein 1a n=1 Tax=Hippocampus comes TaxID=109280 RepID=A0A3Q2XGG5_HIPCM